MSKTTAYTILKRIGVETLCRYIHDKTPNPEFDSHHFTNSFPQHFHDEYAEMLKVHEEEGDNKARNIKISNAMGRYLGNNQRLLRIEKIREIKSTNMNGAKGRVSLWRKA